ncbi:MAG: CBS domain-containing protein [Methanoregula sp.]|nr:CBS domain-containing protein [Methanoregula sp.]
MKKELFVKNIMVKPTTISKSAKITEALDKMLTEGIDPLIALNSTTVVGTVSRQAIAEKLGAKQNSAIAPAAIHVASVVAEDFTSVYPDESVNVLVPLLQRYKLVVVYDTDHKLIGQVSAGDLLKKYIPDDGIESAMEKAVTIDADERVVHLRNLLVKDIMSTPLISVDRNTHVSDVIDMMLKKNISTMPVTEKGKLVGLVTRRSLVMAL